MNPANCDRAYERQVCGASIASLILGVLAFLCSVLAAVPAVILGHVALRKIGRSAGRLKGEGLAISGLVLGYFNTTIFLFILIPFLAMTAVPQLMMHREMQKIMKAKMTVKVLQLRAYKFQVDHGKPPSSFADLKDYFADGKVPEKDPWGGEYVMQQTKDSTVRIRCPNLDVKGGVRTKCWVEGSNGTR